MPAIRQPFWVREPLLRSRGGDTSSLLSGLTHYYKFEEAIGARVDTLGAGNWSVADGTPGRAAGKNNFGANISLGNTLTIPQTTLLTNQFTMAFWLNVASYAVDGINNVPIIASQTINFGFDLVRVVNSTNVFMRIYPASLGPTNVGDVLPIGMHAVVLWVDGVGNGSFGSMGFQVDGGVVNSGVFTSPSTGFKISAETEKLSFASTVGVQGVFDEMAVWNRVLTDSERAAWYNSGAGKFYPFS